MRTLVLLTDSDHIRHGNPRGGGGRVLKTTPLHIAKMRRAVCQR